MAWRPLKILEESDCFERRVWRIFGGWDFSLASTCKQEVCFGGFNVWDLGAFQVSRLRVWGLGVAGVLVWCVLHTTPSIYRLHFELPDIYTPQWSTVLFFQVFAVLQMES